MTQILERANRPQTFSARLEPEGEFPTGGEIDPVLDTVKEVMMKLGSFETAKILAKIVRGDETKQNGNVLELGQTKYIQS